MVARQQYVEVVFATPLRRRFDYLLPAQYPQQVNLLGARVVAPFGKKKVVGVVVHIKATTDVAEGKIKSISHFLDEAPVLSESLLHLMLWASDYYQHPVGDVVLGALPKFLRLDRPLRYCGEAYCELTEQGKAVDLKDLTRAPKQSQLLTHLAEYDQPSMESLLALGFKRDLISMLAKKAWLNIRYRACTVAPTEVSPSLALTTEQQHCVEKVGANLNEFKPFLLEGVTGSGKTEVYLQLIAKVLASGKQALVLVPEIGLTPQTLQRFRQRFYQPVVCYHSGMSDSERMDSWLMASQGKAAVVIGTRSAVFLDLKNLGVIIIDEEHDLSFKQQESFRYSARDIAIKRAHGLSIPILLGSATPSLESLYNVRQRRYESLQLTERTGAGGLPPIRLLDIRKQNLRAGLSEFLLASMKQHLDGGHQVLLFLNRRGYAPSLICHVCGDVVDCPRCDAHLTLHHQPPRLHCHHCDYTQPVPHNCCSCGGTELHALGLGTEQLEEALQQCFPDQHVLRIDGDTTRARGSLSEKLTAIHNGDASILLGTQMLAKGHHFPDVSLVAIVDVDSGLFSVDFRAPERLAQLVTQVAGRAGRGDLTGEVILQTRQPQHPLLQGLATQSYREVAELELQERQQAQLTPYSYFALVRAEALSESLVVNFLRRHEALGRELSMADKVWLLGPVPSPMARRSGRYRAQLMVQSQSRMVLQQFLHALVDGIEADKESRKVRWNVDVDPQDIY